MNTLLRNLLNWFIIIAFAACIPQTANANNQHEGTMMIATKRIPELTEKDKARFWSKVDKRGNDDCWPWTAGLIAEGYGQFGKGSGRCFRSHRVAYVLTFGEIEPLSLIVCHSCDNPACCNPAHLFLGTHKDNADDRTAKGRHVVTNRKFTDEEMRSIRRERLAGQSVKEIASKHGCHTSTVHRLTTGRTWKTLT